MPYSTIQKDFYRESGQWLSGAALLKKLVNPNLLYLFIFRKCQQNRRGLLGKIWRLLLRRYQVLYGYQIYPETQIGPGLYLGHWGALVINPQAVIGANCNIAQGVTIGQQNRGRRQGAPTIGSRVWIGANAVIVGNISIGNNVLIAPNAYVNADVPDNSVVVGNPATALPRENATEGYLNFTV